MRTIAIALCSLLLIAAAPPHYRIDATLGPDQDAVEARAQIRFETDRPGEEYRFIIGRSFRVIDAHASGADVRVEPTEQPFPGALQAIIVKPKPGVRGPLRLDVRYVGKLMALQQPPMNGIDPDLVELTVDSMWLPYPADLNVGLTAEADFRGIPRNAVAVSTGDVSRRGDRLHVSLRRKNDLALIASPSLKSVREGRFRYYAADPDSALMRTYRHRGPEALSMMERVLGPIPGNSVRVTAVRRANPAGYNRPGYIVVADRLVDTPEPSLAMSLAHEIAHTWFSKANFLSEDYWLVEGTADYMAHRYGEEVYGSAVLRSYLERAERRARKSGPILGHGRPNDNAAYGRGNMLLRSLEARLGTPKMDALLRDFVRQPTHTTAGFLATLGRHGGPALAKEYGQALTAKDYQPLAGR